MYFPVKLDKRKEFQLRYQHIVKVIDQVTQEFQPFFSIEVEDEIVDWPKERALDLANFPYHYNQRTYQMFADRVRAIGVFFAAE